MFRKTAKTPSSIRLHPSTRRRRERFNLEGNSGKTAWFSLAYRSANNQVGPFCPPFSAIVP